MKAIDPAFVCVNQYALLQARAYYQESLNFSTIIMNKAAHQVSQYAKLTGESLINDSRYKDCQAYWNKIYFDKLQLERNKRKEASENRLKEIFKTFEDAETQLIEIRKTLLK